MAKKKQSSSVIAWIFGGIGIFLLFIILVLLILLLTGVIHIGSTREIVTNTTIIEKLETGVPQGTCQLV